jgi:hypothetical protein
MLQSSWGFFYIVGNGEPLRLNSTVPLFSTYSLCWLFQALNRAGATRRFTPLPPETRPFFRLSFSVIA